MKNERYLPMTATICVSVFLLMFCRDEATETESGLTNDKQAHILIFSKTTEFRHDSIETGTEALKEWASERGVATTHTENADYFTTENLSRYGAVVFLHTSGTLFDETQRNVFKQYIRNGGGYVGVHAASDTEKEWPWYGRLVGAYFDNHPPGVSEAVIDVVNPDHPSTRMLPETWSWVDEWYNWNAVPEHVNVLLKVDTDSYEGSDHPGNHPIAWYHDYDGGQVFFTGLGHTDEAFSEEKFMQHLWGGITSVMNKNHQY